MGGQEKTVSAVTFYNEMLHNIFLIGGHSSTSSLHKIMYFKLNSQKTCYLPKITTSFLQSFYAISLCLQLS